MNLNPLVSIIIPTYNREVTISRAVESVLCQTYKNFELIIINDGSVDKTDKILLTYEQTNIRLFKHEKNLGVSAARNLGIAKSKGEYICFLDSDDEWFPQKLESQIHFLSLNPETVCIHTDEVWIRNGVRVNQMKKHKKGGGKQFLSSLKLCVISPSTVFIKKQVLIDLGCFREDFPVCEDYDLWLKLTSLYEIGYIDETLILKYGGHEDQLSRKFVAMDYYRILSMEWILKNRRFPLEEKKHILEILLSKCDILIKGYLRHGNLENLARVEVLKSEWLSLRES